MIKKLLLLSLLAMPALSFGATNPLSVDLAGTTFVLPFQKVSAVQLYSFADKKGYPGAETVLAAWGQIDIRGDRKAELTFGAAPVLGTSRNVPFCAFKIRLPERYFDLSGNSMMFGAWVGKETGKPHATYGVSASIALW